MFLAQDLELVLLLLFARQLLYLSHSLSLVQLLSCLVSSTDPSVLITKVQEVSVSSFIPHPLCVAGVFLTSLTSESGSKVQHTSREAESLLLNVSGKLLMFQRDRSGPQIRDTNDDRKIRSVRTCFIHLCLEMCYKELKKSRHTNRKAEQNF